jgi:DNA topoisomerase-1
MEAYCVKCKTKREMSDARALFTAAGAPATQGVCPVCGSKMYRMGRTPAHAELGEPEPPRDGKKLVIVESPAKARTVGKFLGAGYDVEASVGHVRDLPKNRLGVDLEHDFEPRYVIPSSKDPRKDMRPVVSRLRELARKASEIYLATDPDREGEAISWHLAAVLEPVARRRPMHRVEFHEITRDAIAEAFSQPRAIDQQRVYAQQARRILDRLVGYKLSPLLREKIGRKGLSAGRVQSVAVRLIVEREREIQAFQPQEYWTIAADLAKLPDNGKLPPSFSARLLRIDGAEADIPDEARARALVGELERAAYRVARVERKERRRNPAAPFITSTLQQEASRKLGMAPRRTMAIAQALYMGKEVGDGEIVGLITYMRTDSTNVAAVAQAEARDYIAGRYGQDYVPEQPPVYKTRAKGAQEAHEAIRPTSVLREPAALKSYLDRDEYRLYDLIWKRFIASQMEAAVLDVVSVDVEAAGQRFLLRAGGSTVRFPGFLAVYEEGHEEGDLLEPEDESRGMVLPDLNEGDVVEARAIVPEQHFTAPPPRYTEAALIRALEEDGIGRPSTYAAIMETVVNRGYIERVERKLVPTDMGMLVTDLLTAHFADVVTVGFTAEMESELDQVASGELEWVPMLRNFYGPFSADLARAQVEMPQVTIEPEPYGEDCPECGRPLMLKRGRFGKFVGCSGYPACRFSKAIPLPGVRCPECGGEIVEKKTRKGGRRFFSCANFKRDDPSGCKFSTWNMPIPTPCPECGGLLVEASKDGAKCLKCERTFVLEAIQAQA